MTQTRSDIRNAAETEYKQLYPPPQPPVQEAALRRPQVIAANHDERLWVEIKRSYARQSDLALRYKNETLLIKLDEMRVLRSEIDRAIEDFEAAEAVRLQFEAYEKAQSQWDRDKYDFISAAVRQWEKDTGENSDDEDEDFYDEEDDDDDE